MERKKRVRPTKADIKKLEDVIERQCAELRGWKEKYDTLTEDCAMQILAKNRIIDECIGLKCCNHALEQSNELMEAELKRLRLRIENLKDERIDLKCEITALKKRNLLQRVFNCW